MEVVLDVVEAGYHYAEGEFLVPADFVLLLIVLLFPLGQGRRQTQILILEFKQFD